MRRTLLWTALVAILAAGGLAACQTTQTLKLDDPSFAEWQRIPREQSEVYFDGPGQPRVTGTWMRWVDGVVRSERIRLEPKSGFRESALVVWLAPVYFGEDVSNDFRAPGQLMQVAHERCEGTAVSDVSEGRNGAGTFLHASCRLRDGTLCVVAQQGINNLAKPGEGPKYEALAVLGYCSLTESESEMLDYLGTLRFGKALDGKQARDNSI